MTGNDWKDTVTVTFIANFEIDPEEFDLRMKDETKVRRELLDAIVPGSASIQAPLANTGSDIREIREKIAEAKS